MVKIKIPKKPPKIPKIPKIPKVPKTPKKPKVTKPKKPPGTVKGPSKKAIAGGLAAAGLGTGIGLYMKNRDKDAAASSPKNEQPGRGGKQPYKPYEKPTRPYGKKGLRSGPKKKRKLSLDPAVKYSKGVVRDSKGKVVRHKKLTAAEIRERQKNR